MRKGTLELTGDDRAWLSGEHSVAGALAMRIIVSMAEVLGAERLVDIESAHIDGCLYHGRAGLDFVERLVAGGGQAAVQSTLNVSSLDLLHPELYGGDAQTAQAARAQMDAYEALGCRPTWTCAPYQLVEPPLFGQQIAWGESNAVVFANSVLGARTNCYGDFADVSASITGRVPATGLHLDEGWLATIVIDVGDTEISAERFGLLGHVIGHRAGWRVVLVDGIVAATEDELKAMGAAAASTGSVALIHVAGITPEAIDQRPVADLAERIAIDARDLRAARDSLDTVAADRLDAVSVGTPHASERELRTLAPLVAGRPVAPELMAYVSTGRDVVDAAGDSVGRLEVAGWRVVTDTCTYITPIIERSSVVMTDSAKWAFYAPSNIGVDVVFGSLGECVESAVAGRVVRDG